MHHSIQDVDSVAHFLVQQFLDREGYATTLSAFQREAQEAGRDVIAVASSGSIHMDLRDLIELYSSHQLVEAERKASKMRQVDLLDPSSIVLPGPPALRFEVVETWANLHTSNILSLAMVTLPTRFFDTSNEPQYRFRQQRCLLTTSADRRIVFTNIDERSPFGEVVETLEAAAPASLGHTAAVLCAAQHPQYEREIVTCGMDSRAIVWDLLLRRPSQVLTEHSRFVIRCCFSPCGKWLSTASYDRTICIYIRSAEAAGQLPVTPDEEPDLLQPDYQLVHTVRTSSNPECILFVPCLSGKRLCLAFTLRNSCLIHYLPLPPQPIPAGPPLVTNLSQQMERLLLAESPLRSQAPAADESPEAPLVDWKVVAFNTNMDPYDFHVSYSFLSIELHPSKQLLSLQTGDHALPTSGTATTTSPMSRIILLPLLSGRRVGTIWTGAATSPYAAPRQSWLPSGLGLWVTGEDGIMRLADFSKVRASIPVHGAAIEAASRAMIATTTEERLASAISWSRGGNTIIKDVCVLDERGSFASCGFDRTVRIVRPC